MIDLRSDATSTARENARTWREIDWEKAERAVQRLQARIVKATEKGNWRRVKNLQRLLTSSRSAKALAVRRVTESEGRETAGVGSDFF